MLLGLAAMGCNAATPPIAVTFPPSPVARVVGAPAAADDALWAEFAARPLRLPALTLGAPCPTSASRALSGTGPGAGDGPIYPVGSSPLTSGPQQVHEVLWTAAPDYQGPALIRGRRLDGADVISFAYSPNTTTNPLSGATELRFPVTAVAISDHSALGWRDFPSVVFVARPGCYAYQIDGTGFMTIVVFAAK